MLGTLIEETLIIGSVFAVVTVVFFLVIGNLLLIGAPLRLLLSKKVQNLGLRTRAGYETIDECVQVHHCICQRAHIVS